VLESSYFLFFNTITRGLIMSNSPVTKLALYAMVIGITVGSTMIYSTQTAPTIMAPATPTPTITTVDKSSYNRHEKVMEAGLLSLAGLGFVNGVYNFYNASVQTKVTTLLTSAGFSALIYYSFIRRPELTIKKNMKFLGEALLIPVGVLSVINGIRTIASTTCTGATKLYKKITEESVVDDYEDEDDGDASDTITMKSVVTPEITPTVVVPSPELVNEVAKVTPVEATKEVAVVQQPVEPTTEVITPAAIA
jgi:hypothetical protein